MSIGEQKEQSIDTSQFSEYEEMQYKQGKIRKYEESTLSWTISPILSLFLSKKLSDYIKKIVQLVCYIMAYMFYLSIFYNIEEWNISEDDYLMVPLPLLAIGIAWVSNYVLGFIRMKLEKSMKMQGLYIYAVFAFLYYAGMSVGITFEMKGSTDDRSHKFAYSALLGLAIDFFLLDFLLILLVKLLSLQRKIVWSFFRAGGFAEDEFTQMPRNVKQIMGEDGLGLQKDQVEITEHPQTEQQQQVELQQEQQQEQQQSELQPENNLFVQGLQEQQIEIKPNQQQQSQQEEEMQQEEVYQNEDQEELQKIDNSPEVEA